MLNITSWVQKPDLEKLFANVKKIINKKNALL